MEPDDHGGTQTGVILWRVTDCAFKVQPTGDSSSKGSHNKLLSVKLTCRWICSWCMSIFCVSGMIVWTGVVEWSFPVLWLGHSGIVGKLESAITLSLDSMMFSLCILWSNTCSPLLPLFWFFVPGNLPRGNVVGKPSLGHGCHVGDLS